MKISDHFDRPTIPALLLFVAAAFAPGPARAAAPARFTPRIVNGRNTSDYPSVGALVFFTDPEHSEFDGLCSGTLIGCRTFLTAAHCVCNGEDAASCEQEGTVDASLLSVYLPSGGMFAVDRVSFHPEFFFAERGDVALVRLAAPATGIRPSPINTLQRAAHGTPGTIVGFGLSIRGREIPRDAGIKRAGKVTTAACETDIPEDTHVCWTFTGSESNSCEGDSGGPLFVDFGSGPVVAGVVSGGESFDCGAPDAAFDSDVYVNRDWITATAGDDLGTESCGGLVPVGDTGTLQSDFGGTLSRAGASLPFSFQVPDGTAELRVSLNGQEGSGTGGGRVDNDFDLYLKAGSEPTMTTYDCHDSNVTPFGSCRIDVPSPGAWHAMVVAHSGSGTVQLTATSFASLSGNACVGDCKGDGMVTVDEILAGVNIALGTASIESCPMFDRNTDGIISIDELVSAISAAILGCAPN